MRKAFAAFLILFCAFGLFAQSAYEVSVSSAATAGGYDREELKRQFLTLADEVLVDADSVTFTDSSEAGMVTIRKNPKKVYNLYASLTTLWYEAGGVASGVIGGSSSAETYKAYIGRDVSKDDGVEVLATSSSGSKWSTEKIIAGNPDLIICSTAMSGYKTINGPAAAAGIPVIAVSYNSFADYLKWFKVFCNISGHPELWESVALKALDEVLDVIMEVPSDGNPSVFIMFTAAGRKLQANLEGTVVGDMAKILRAKNIAYSKALDESGAERVDINLESVYAAQPDIIMIQCHGETEDAKAQVANELGGTAIWQSLDAVKNGRVYYLEKLFFHNKPNRRFAEAYQTMAQILYPDVHFSFQNR
ncbi:MAG: ABC transporter substrate-binding protein [Sphaerochaeta sp.]